MTEQAVFEQVRKIVADQLFNSESEITRDSSFVDDLGADSLDMVELVMEIEEQLAIVIPDEDCEKLKTVGSVVNFIVEKRKLGVN